MVSSCAAVRGRLQAVREAMNICCCSSYGQVVANETKVVVQREEAEAGNKAMETQAIADDAQRDLDEALPALVRRQMTSVTQ